MLEVGRVEDAGRQHNHGGIRIIMRGDIPQGGKEILLGMNRDPQFGPLIVCGFGGIDVEHAEVRNERVEAVLIMETDTVDANLVIMPPHLERVALKYRDGRPRERIRAGALGALLSE